MTTSSGVLRMTAHTTGTTAPTVSRSTITYPNAWPGTDLTYTVDGGQVSESIVVKSAAAATSYPFKLGAGASPAAAANTPVTLQHQPDGSVTFTGALASAASLAAPLVWTQTGSPVAAAQPAMTVAGPGSLSLSLNKTWLAVQPAAAFPITLDPSVTLNPTANRSYKSDGTTCTSCDIQFGNSQDGGNTYWRSVTHYNYEQLFGSKVTGASMKATYISGTGSPDAYKTYVYYAPKFSYAGAKNGSVLASGTISSSGTLSGSGLTSTLQSWVSNRTSNAYFGFVGQETAGLYTYKKVDVTLTIDYTSASTVPGAPTKVTATAGDKSAAVKFSAPSDNGGSAITSYTATSSPGGITKTGAASPITITGLTNGTSYTFTVKATNAVGTGPASTASNSVTPTASPSINCYDSSNHCWGVDRLTPLTQSDLDDIKSGIGDGHYPDFVGRYITRGDGNGLLTSSEVSIYHADDVAIELLADKTGGCADASTGTDEADSAVSAAATLGLTSGSNVAIILDEDETTATSACETAYADEIVRKGYQPGFYLNPGDFSGEAYCGAISDDNVANAVVWSDEQETEESSYDRNDSLSFNPEQPTCGSGLTTYGWQYIQPNVEANYGQSDLTDGYDCDEVAPDRTSSLWLP